MDAFVFRPPPPLRRPPHAPARGVILVAVMLAVVIGSISTAALLNIVALEANDATRAEVDAHASYVAMGAMTFAKLKVVWTGSMSAWNALLSYDSAADASFSNTYPLDTRYRWRYIIRDNVTDTDPDPLVDGDGIVEIVATAWNPNGESVTWRSTARRPSFTQYLQVRGNADFRLGSNYYADGRLHTNQDLEVLGSGVVLDGHVGISGNRYLNGHTDAQFNGGYTTGAAPLSFSDVDFGDLYTKATTTPTGLHLNDLIGRPRSDDVSFRLTFYGSGSLAGKMKVEYYSGGWLTYAGGNPPGYLNQSDYSLLYGNRNIYVSGTYGGGATSTDLTIVDGNSSGRDIFVTDNLVPNDAGPNGDFLGLISRDDIYLYDMGDPSHSNPSTVNATIQAALWAKDRVTGYGGASYTGKFMFKGSVSFGGNGVISMAGRFPNGRLYFYDDRLFGHPPPNFPELRDITGTFVAGSWQRLYNSPLSPP